MLNTYKWRIIPSNQPTVIRNCPKCGNHHEYVNSQNFRVNANQNHIDVWLIYQCSKCKSTWNMEILSRINPNVIDKELYLKFLSNDKELAKQFAFDTATHSRNKSVLNYENISFEIISDSDTLPLIDDSCQIELICEYPLDIRMDKILSQKLCISREQIKKMCGTGKITGAGIKDVGKAKVKNGMLLQFNC